MRRAILDGREHRQEYEYGSPLRVAAIPAIAAGSRPLGLGRHRRWGTIYGGMDAWISLRSAQQ